MTIIEAIKSGKRFGRKSWDDAFPLGPPEPNSGMQTLILRTCDIIADDWEIEEETIELSAEQIREALGRAWDSYAFVQSLSHLTNFGGTLLKELGFKG